MGWNKERATEFITSMPGRKILILGNHDRGRSMKWYYDVGFHEVYKYPIIFQEFYILSHEPIEGIKGTKFVNIHGHTHSKIYSDYKGYVSVSVEVIGYKPVCLDDIKKRFVTEGDINEN